MQNQHTEIFPEPPDKLRVGQVAKLLGVSTDTVKRYEKAGRITAARTPTGHRRFAIEDVRRLLAEAEEQASA